MPLFVYFVVSLSREYVFEKKLREGFEHQEAE